MRSPLFSFVVLSLGSFGALAACDSYAPDLGERPFLCGQTGDECPDGYEPRSSGNQCVCVLPSGGGGGDCTDQYEPNETTGAAFMTPVGAGSSTVTLADPSLCPATDVDTYSFQTSTNNAGATATVTFGAGDGPLGVNIVSVSGTPIATGTVSGTQAQVSANLPTAGTYYVQVVSAGGEGDYTLSIALTTSN